MPAGGIPMRVAHFDCFSGISGDMTLGALIDAGVDAAEIRRVIASLGLPITVEIEKVRKGGFARHLTSASRPRRNTPSLPAGRRSHPPARRAQRPSARPGPAHLPPPGRGRGAGAWHAARQGPLPRGRRPRQHRRHRRLGRRARPARRRALHQPIGADRQRHGQVRPRPDADSRARHGRAAQGCAAGRRRPSRRS